MFLVKTTSLHPFGLALPEVWSSTTVATALHMDNRCTTLEFAHGVTKASFSLSFMTFTTQPIVGVPKIMGIHSANFDSPRMIRLSGLHHSPGLHPLEPGK